MPSEAVLNQKKAFVAELAGKLETASAGVLVDYRGINVADDTKLRRELRAAGVEYSVVKNTLLSLACEKAGYESLKAHLKGTTALAISRNDPVAAAKILVEHAKKSKVPFKVKAGFVEGRVINAGETESLAALPPREQLVARVLGGLNAPISGLVNVLNGNIRGLVVALNAIAEQKAS
ncbi:50S ribosomal protein L10 [Clostridia bacterium]|nr:50S ribosomal protein L10 [Clostridia bacterium]